MSTPRPGLHPSRPPRGSRNLGVVRRFLGSRWLNAALWALAALCVPACCAASPSCPEGVRIEQGQPTLRVGVKYAPPFVLESERSGWTGLGVELWEAVAACMGAKQRYIEYPTVDELLDAVARGEVDVAVSALSLSSQRERRVDFTHAFHVGSLGVLVPHRADHGAATEIGKRARQPEVLAAAGALAAATLLIAYGCWRLERGRGNAFFSQGPASGFYQALLWSVQLVFSGRGDPFSIRHRGGQLLVFFLTFSGATIVSAVTAVITSALTLEGIDQRIRSVDDLKSRALGVMVSGRAREWVLGERLPRVQLRSWPEVQRKFDEHGFNALVHDRDILEYLVKERVLHEVRVEPLSFNPQAYAFALPPGSALREAIDVSLLAVQESAGWTTLKAKYLGTQ
jgi:polar amino acid transport system substrate-binding protein